MVGYLGDGINDAPSLHAADVGISVASAVDVAKDAADIILLEPGLRVLHNGILEGRKAFGNVMKYLLMGTSSNFGNMFSMAGGVAVPALPADAADADPAQQLPLRPGAGHHPDRQRGRSVHREAAAAGTSASSATSCSFIGPISSIYDFLTFFVLLWLFHAAEALFHTGWFVESLATQTLVLFVIRTAGNPFRSRPSLPLAITTLTVVLVGIILPFSPLASFLGFVPLPLDFFLFLTLLTVTYLLVVQVAKRRLMRRWLGE